MRDTDQALLDLLEANARLSVTDLARKLRLARSTVQDRLTRLEKSGAIAGYTIRRGPGGGARPMRAHVMLSVDAKLAQRSVAELKAMPALRRLVTVSGEYDLIAEVTARDTEALDAALDQIGRLPGVKRTLSSIVLSVKAER